MGMVSMRFLHTGPDYEVDMSTSILEIAKIAGVSKTTVSRVINKQSNVNEQTRRRVEEVIERYNYIPNARAQAFSSQKSMSIGLALTSDATDIFTNPYFSDLLRGVFLETRKSDYHVVITYLEHNDCLDMVNRKLVDGVLVLTPGKDNKKQLQRLIESGIPIAATSRVEGLPELHYVAVDEYDASCRVMEHLIGFGHRKIGLIVGPKRLYSNNARLRAYKVALKKYGIAFDADLVRFGDTSANSGYEQMNSLLEARPDITAVFACSDMMAIGAKRAVEERNLRVPADISLVGSDGISLSELLGIGLTTLNQPTYERGRIATEHLIRMIHGEDVGNSVMLQMDIAFHSSTEQRPSL